MTTTTTGHQAGTAAATATEGAADMAAKTAHKFNTDALVTIDDPRFPGIVWKVVKQPVGARGVNYVLSNVTTPGARGYRAAEYQMTAFDGTEDDARDPSKIGGRQRAAVVESFEIAPPIGAVVTVKHPQIDERILFVVIGDKVDGVKLVRVGGDGGRYYPKIPTKLVTVVEVADVPTRIPGHIAAVAAADAAPRRRR